MCEIRQALIEATARIVSAPPPGADVIGLLTLSNPHQEENPRTHRQVEVADFHGDEISFAVPIDLLESIRQMPLATQINSYLVIEGTDVLGSHRTYAVRITQNMVSRLAYKLYVVLSGAIGEDFAKQHALDWESWMQARAPANNPKSSPAV